jgi:monoamine oxidase
MEQSGRSGASHASDDTDSRGMRRRAFVGSAAAGAAAFGLPGPARALAGATSRNVDAVVVGAGVSGLAAAWRLRRNGRSVVVLEASERLGGRVLNLSTGPRPHQVTEAGGEWVAARQKRILALCKTFGIQTFPTYDKGKTVYFDGEAHPFSGTVPPIGGAAQAEVLAAMLQLTEMCDQVPVDAPETAKHAKKWDSKTVASWIDDNVTTAKARAILRDAVGGPVGGTAKNTSLLGYLFIAKSNGGPLHLVTVRGGGLAFRIKGGSGLIVDALAQRVGAGRIKLSTPVRQINRGTSSVQVITDDGTYTSSHVIVAVPPPMAGRIGYDPPLPPARDQFTQHAAMGWLIKCFAVYPKPFWREKGLNGIVNSVAPPLAGVFDNSPDDGSVGCLYGLIAGDDARIQTGRSAEKRRQSVLDTFKKCFGDAAGSPTKYFEYNWARQRFIGGGAAVSWAPGVLTMFPGAVRDPVGPIHWASTETATDNWGDMDGAITAGERAADEVLA